MPSKPYTRSLNRLRKQKKPLTPSQIAFVQQQAKNREQAGQASQGLFDNNQCPSGEPSEWVDITLTNQSNEPEDSRMTLEHDSEDHFTDTEILNHLNRARYDARRLENASRWEEQCQSMLPTFLRCREVTSVWGDESNWNTDQTTGCACHITRHRHGCVDMVDILCNSFSSSL